MYRLCFFFLMMAGITALPLIGQNSQSSRTGRPIVLVDCPISPEAEIHVPVKVAGVLSELLVKEGDEVKEGQLVAKTDDVIAQVDLEEKKALAQDESAILSAKAALEEQTAARDDTKKLYLNRVESEEKYRLAEAKVKVATYQLAGEELKKEQLKFKELAAEEMLRRYEIRSPIDGVVVERAREKGEAVKELEPILRIINADTVKIEGTLNLRDADRVREGAMIEVYPNKLQAELFRLNEHTGRVNDVKVLPDGKRCVSAGDDGVIIVWDLQTGNRLRRITGHEGPVRSLAVSPSNPDRLVSAGADGKILVWDLAAKNGPVAKKIDGETFAFDLTGLVPMQTIRSQVGDVISMTLHPKNPDICITGHEDRQIRIWDLKAGTETKRLSGHTNHVTTVAVTPNGKYLFSAASDQTARVWDLEQGKELAKYPGRSNEIPHIGLSPDGSAFLFNNGQHLWARRLDGNTLAEIENRHGSFTDFSIFAPHAGLVLTADESRQIQLWEPSRGERYPRLVRRYDGHIGRINAADFAMDGSLFVTGGDDKVVHVWEVPSPKQIKQELKTGSISFVNRQLEAGSQTLLIRAEVDNQDGVLTPGSFATMVIYPDTIVPKTQASATAPTTPVAAGK